MLNIVVDWIELMFRECENLKSYWACVCLLVTYLPVRVVNRLNENRLLPKIPKFSIKWGVLCICCGRFRGMLSSFAAIIEGLYFVWYVGYLKIDEAHGITTNNYVPSWCYSLGNKNKANHRYHLVQRKNPLGQYIFKTGSLWLVSSL